MVGSNISIKIRIFGDLSYKEVERNLGVAADYTIDKGDVERFIYREEGIKKISGKPAINREWVRRFYFNGIDVNTEDVFASFLSRLGAGTAYLKQLAERSPDDGDKMPGFDMIDMAVSLYVEIEGSNNISFSTNSTALYDFASLCNYSRIYYYCLAPSIDVDDDDDDIGDSEVEEFSISLGSRCNDVFNERILQRGYLRDISFLKLINNAAQLFTKNPWNKEMLCNPLCEMKLSACGCQGFSLDSKDVQVLCRAADVFSFDLRCISKQHDHTLLG